MKSIYNNNIYVYICCLRIANQRLHTTNLFRKSMKNNIFFYLIVIHSEGCFFAEYHPLLVALRSFSDARKSQIYAYRMCLYFLALNCSKGWLHIMFFFISCNLSFLLIKRRQEYLYGWPIDRFCPYAENPSLQTCCFKIYACWCPACISFKATSLQIEKREIERLGF